VDLSAIDQIFVVLYLPLLTFGGVILLTGAWFSIRQRKRIVLSGISEIDQMDGKVFEDYLKELFNKLGFKVSATRRNQDQGGDLVIEKGKVRTVVQAKRWSRVVGNAAVQQVVAAKAIYKCQRALVVTNSKFSDDAWESAMANRVTLWGRKRLIDAILFVKEDKNPWSHFDPVSLIPRKRRLIP
jgi:restriction system protein